MKDPAMDCTFARTHLLDHLYGALDDAEASAMEAHLASCGECRAALEAARADRALLGEASRMAGGDLRFAPPAPRPWWRRPLRRAPVPQGWGWRHSSAAALLLGLLAFYGYRTAEWNSVAALNPRVVVAGPRLLIPGSPAVYSVSVTSVDGDPMKARVVASLPGRPPLEAETDDTGRAEIRFPGSPLAPGERNVVKFSIERGPDHVPVLASVNVMDGRRLLARVSTDRPIYRPGGTIRLRAVILDRMSLAPAGPTAYRYRLIDAQGSSVAQGEGTLDFGAGGGEMRLADDAPGGEYRVILDDPIDHFTPVERSILVQEYRPPRIRGDLVLDRDSYGPGDRGVLRARIGRIEGGVPTGASIDAVLTVDGEERSRTTHALAASGLLAVPFAIPAGPLEGRATLGLLVKDGGVVETLSTSVPLATDHLLVEFYPEGGDLVAGIRSRVYFRVLDPALRAADLKADLVDAAGERVLSFEVDTLGMGCFELTPVAGATYRVESRRPAGIRLEGTMPPVLPKGAALRALREATAEGDGVPLEVQATEPGEYSLAAWCRGALVAETRVSIEAGVARRVELRPTSPVAGVLRVTLLDGKGVPRAERLVAAMPRRRVDLAFRATPAVAAPGDRVRVDVEARDEDGRPVAARLGVAVVDEGVFAAAGMPEAASLPLHFLLGMEVDELEKAAVFEGGPGAARAVDLLLGVQGWRRFGWRDPAGFAFRHPGAGARVESVPTNSLSPVRLDNGPEAQAAVNRAVTAVDSVALEWAWGFLGLLTLAGFIALAAEFLRREGRRLHVWIPIGTLTVAIFVVAFGVHLWWSGGGRGGGTSELLYVIDGEPRPSAPMLELSSESPYIPPEACISIGNTINWGGGSLRSLGYLAEMESPGRPDPLVDGTLGDPRFASIPEAGVFREFAVSHQREPRAGDVRSDFTEVLFWDPMLRTGPDGKASFQFDTSDAITSFRVSLEGHDGSGRLGAGRSEIRNRTPFFLEPKTPLALSAGDRVDLPLVVGNDTGEAISVAARVTAEGPLLRAVGPESRELFVAAGARRRVLFGFEAQSGRGAASLAIEGRGARGLVDRSVRTIRVEPRGYPVEIAVGGVVTGKDEALVGMPDDFVPGSMSGTLRLYPSVAADLADGVESLLEIPHGCFEQVSSSNYPNVMALDLMDEVGNGTPEALRRARGLLESGYRQLAAYECPGRGYEWWGKDPAHEVLTAYGLLEFTDMKRVVAVDEGMLARTREWLLSRRDGRGGFSNGQGKYAEFSRTPPELGDAYIVWAMSESDPSLDLAPEIARMEERALASADPYLVALAARTLGIRKLPGAAALRARLAGMQGEDGGLRGTTTSVTGSGGANLDVETTALAVLAFLPDRESLARADAGVRFLAGKRIGGGRFGTTQATVLALKALVEHARVARRTGTDHDVEILVNGAVVARRHIAAGEPGAVVLGDEVVGAFRPGPNRILLRSSSAERLPWALNLAGYARVPPSSLACAVEATAVLSKAEVVEGESVSLAVEIRNRTDEIQPMTVVRVGLPGGLESRAEALKRLLEDGALDFWETGPREVTAYFRGLRAGETRRFTLDLTAAIPGEFEGAPTAAYLYYTDDLRTFAPPLHVVVKPATTDR